MKKTIKNTLILFMIIVILASAGCGAPAEPAQEEPTQAGQETIAPKKEKEEPGFISKETADELKERLMDTEFIDIRQMTPKQIVSEQYLLHMTVLRDISVIDGEIYYIQKLDSSPSDMVIQHLGKDGLADEWMTLLGFGGGLCFNGEKGKDGSIYFWTESNGNVSSAGQTLSRVKFENGKTYVDQGDLTWFLKQSDGAPYAAVDTENGIVCTRIASTGGYKFSYYCLQDMIDGKNPEPIYEIESPMITNTLDDSVNPDKISLGDYNFHGFAISGKYIYQYYGKAATAICIACMDMEGNFQYVHKINEYKDLVYREPDGLCIADGKLYFGITSGESADRRANVFIYE